MIGLSSNRDTEREVGNPTGRLKFINEKRTIMPVFKQPTTEAKSGDKKEAKNIICADGT